MLCLCMCEVAKAVVSHPHASIACYHGSHTASTPPPHVLLFFFYPPLFLILFLLHRLLFFFLSDSQMTPPPPPMTSLPPSLALCCGESYCTLRFSLLLSSTSQQGKPECQPLIRKMRYLGIWCTSVCYRCKCNIFVQDVCFMIQLTWKHWKKKGPLAQTCERPRESMCPFFFFGKCFFFILAL